MDEVTLKKVQASIKEAEKKLDELKKDISTAKLGGLDVTEREREYSELNKKVTALKTAYM